MAQRPNVSDSETPSRVRRRVLDPLTSFLHHESAGGVLLLAAAVIAMLWANSQWSESYFNLWHTELQVGTGSWSISLDLQHWVNDLLMVLFFFVVGLEIKRELVTGELSTRRAAALPAIAAAGGVVLPAIIYTAVSGGGDAAPGWAIPVATDIAFAVGILSLLGSRISPGVRLFLLSIAIIDDIIAIGIIAVFYTADIEAIWLVVALAAFLATWGFQKAGIYRIAAYIPLGAIAWLAVFESGVHATIAGVVLGLMTPAAHFRGRPIRETLEKRLHPLSAFLIVPLFALANAGVDLRGGVLGDAVESSVTWGIASGLVVGKLLGISAATFLAIKLGIGTLPRGMRRVQVWGVAAIAGIGFTVSLFIADLSFGGSELLDAAKVGIFLGSIVAGVFGLLLSLKLSRAPDSN